MKPNRALLPKTRARDLFGHVYEWAGELHRAPLWRRVPDTRWQRDYQAEAAGY